MRTLILGFSFLFCGCAVQYKEIYKAVRCDVELPQKPKKSGDRIEMLRDILIYSNLLEQKLKACKGEADGSSNIR